MSQELVDYTMDYYRLRDFERDNADLLAHYQNLKDNLTESELILKEYARQNGAEENESITVTVQAKVKRWYDADTMLARMPGLAQIKGLFTMETKATEKLIKGNFIPADLVAAAIRTEDLTPAVSIKLKISEPARAEA